MYDKNRYFLAHVYDDLNKDLSIIIDADRAKQLNVTQQQQDLIANIISEEVTKIRQALDINCCIEVLIEFTNSVTEWGSAYISKKYSNNTKRMGTIFLSLMTIQTIIYSKNKCRDTIMHELLHLMPNCFCHDGKWLEYANIINNTYGYQIKESPTIEDISSYHIPIEHIVPNNYRYIIYCPYCRNQQRYLYKTKRVQYPHKYNCKYCGGGHLKLYES